VKFVFRKYLQFLGLALLVAACNDDVATEAPVSDAIASETILRGELLVKFSAQISDDLHSSALNAILGEYRLERLFPVDQNNEAKTRAAGLNRWYRVLFDESVDLNQATSLLKQLPEIDKVQANRQLNINTNRRHPIVLPNQTSRSMSDYTSCKEGQGDGLFNDPHLFRQWGYINPGNQSFARPEAPSIAGCDLNCAEAWQLSTGDPSVIVAVLDEGVMYNHPDLSANMWINEGEELKAGRDADGNGYIDDKYGYNFVTDCGIINPYSRDNTGHGTHVAGTIAAVNNNGIGCCGIAGGNGSGNGVRIMSLQIIDGNNSVTLHNEARAMKYAADNGAVILQCSWGYNSALADRLMGYVPGPATEEEWADTYPLEKEALDYFLTTAGEGCGFIDGGIVVFAAGNESAARPAFPGAYSPCICVGSIAADYTPSTFTDYGEEVDFSAPGGDSDYYGIPGADDDTYDLEAGDERGMILSTLVVDEQPVYGYFEGTSMACPAVSGVVALGLSYAKQMRRHYTNTEFVELMRSTARDLDGYYEGTKIYHYYHTMPGTTTRQMNLANWRGKMGVLPDAGALLRAVATGGNDMRMPNISVIKGGRTEINLSDYFDATSFSVSVADTNIANVTLSGTHLTVTGINLGITSVTLTAGSQTVTISISVKSANGYGWL